MKRYICLFFISAIIFFSVNHAFALSEHLRTEEVKEDDVKGVFTLILYGARDINDIETLAILDLEGDQYTLEPYAPDFDYKVKKGLSEKTALKEAYEFISYHNSFLRQRELSASGPGATELIVHHAASGFFTAGIAPIDGNFSIESWTTNGPAGPCSGDQ